MKPKTFPAKAAFVIANPKSKLLDQLREVLRVKHYSLRTEETYVQWVTRYLKFHREQAGAWRHPRELGATDVVAFLNHLANVEHVAGGTQNQALNALVFLYSQVFQTRSKAFCFCPIRVRNRIWARDLIQSEMESLESAWDLTGFVTEKGFFRPDSGFFVTGNGESATDQGFLGTDRGLSVVNSGFSFAKSGFSRTDPGFSFVKSGFYSTDSGFSFAESGFSGSIPASFSRLPAGFGSGLDGAGAGLPERGWHDFARQFFPGKGVCLAQVFGNQHGLWLATVMLLWLAHGESGRV